jgi:hypothetical protein
MVVLTPHFLEQARARPGLRWTNFPLLAGTLAILASDDLDVDHMAVVGSVKVVYVVREDRRPNNDSVLRITFKTVMPKEYKHNPFKNARTIRVGEVT